MNYDQLESLIEELRSLIARDRWQDSESILADLLALDLSANDCFQIAMFIGDRTEAVAFYRKAISLEPRNLYWYSNLGILYHDLGRCNEAIEVLRSGVSHSSGELWLRLNLANTLIECNDKDAGVAELDKIILESINIELSAEDEEVISNAFAVRGLEARSENLLTALRDIQTSILIFPSNIGAWFELGATLKMLGQYDEAIEVFRLVAHTDEDDGWIPLAEDEITSLQVR